MSCDPRHNSVFMSANSFSTLAIYAGMSISRSHWSLKTPSSTDSVVEYCSVHIHWRAYPRYPWRYYTLTPDLQWVDSVHLWLAPPSGHCPASKPTPSFDHLLSLLYWDISAIHQ
jgi:hypothetical protein